MFDQLASYVRWIARFASIVSIFVLAMFLFGSNEDQTFSNTNEMAGFALFPIGIVLGFLIAWKWERFGAMVSLLSLAGFYFWHLATSGQWPIGFWFAVFTSPAIGFLISGWLGRNSDVKKSHEIT